jgi:hypothetical protein
MARGLALSIHSCIVIANYQKKPQLTASIKTGDSAIASLTRAREVIGNKKARGYVFHRLCVCVIRDHSSGLFLARIDSRIETLVLTRVDQ